MMARTYYLLLTGIHLLSPVLSKALHPCQVCIPKTVLEAPGYGFDIGFDHMTAAVKYTNGTFEALSHKSPGEEYLQLMDQFRHRQNISAENDGRSRELVQIVLDENAINVLVIEITRLIDSFPEGRTISANHIGVSMPGFFDMRAHAHLKEALERMRLLPQRELFQYNEFMAISAYESGMCRFGTATPKTHCGPDGYPGRSIVVVDYGKSALAVSRYIAILGQILGPAEDYFDKSVGRRSAPENRTDRLWERDLGGSSIPKDKAMADIYWRNVTTRVADFISHQNLILRQEKSTLLMEQFVVSGELAFMPEFHKALGNAISISLGQPSLDTFTHQPEYFIDPLFVSAIGAAQLAKDYMDAPQPLGCSESIACTQEREEVYGTSFTRQERRSVPKYEL